MFFNPRRWYQNSAAIMAEMNNVAAITMAAIVVVGSCCGDGDGGKEGGGIAWVEEGVNGPSGFCVEEREVITVAGWDDESAACDDMLLEDTACVVLVSTSGVSVLINLEIRVRELVSSVSTTSEVSKARVALEPDSSTRVLADILLCTPVLLLSST